MGLFLGASQRATDVNHKAVVTHADPAAPGVIAMRVKREVEGAFGLDGLVDGPVPAK